MDDDAFSEDLLTGKLSKLNSSQQSIESLSRWCISHRKKAKQVVEKWETLFRTAPPQQRVSFLYLANDILQNSRRKGIEFVNEFWKVLPTALKSAYDSGAENCRRVASRLVDIWEERKVFGSRGQNLKNEMLGKNPSLDKNPSSLNIAKNSNPIKVLKRDANSMRIKLAVGGVPEKILTAFQLVQDEIVNEEVALNKFRDAVSCVCGIEKDVNFSSQGNLLDTDVVENIPKPEHTIQQCISQLEKIEAIRLALISQLREALEDQESKLELIRSELLVARGQIEQAAHTELQLTSTSSTPPSTNKVIVEQTFPPPQPTNNPTPTPPFHPLTSSVNPTIGEEESKKAAAAAVAAKLTASSSSAQMLASVLSSFVAEEAASKSSGVKRPKLEKPMLFSNSNNPAGANSTYFAALARANTSFPPFQSSTESMSQVHQFQAPFITSPPPAPPAPPTTVPPANSNQSVQSRMIGLPYGYGASNLPPPPSSSNIAMGGGPLQQAESQQPQNQQPQSQRLQQQQPANGGYYRPVVGIGFYGQSH